MARHGDKNTFDTSDVDLSTIDTLDDVLDVASDVMQDYGGVSTNTRVERLARYIAAALGGDPYNTQRVGQVERCRLEHGQLEIRRVGTRFALTQGALTIMIANNVLEAQSIAVALLRVAEHADLE